MKELLDRLKQVDPTTYNRYNTDKIICDMELAIAMKNAWLQACLQEAISDKGYMFSVSHIWPNASLPAYQWKARIFIDPDNIIERRSDLPARALLGAYIAACEAMT
jgi:hypothetical protein